VPLYKHQISEIGNRRVKVVHNVGVWQDSLEIGNLSQERPLYPQA